jgi:hypothetical protein
MYRPSGIAVVTAGLAALALFHVVWGHDTHSAKPWTHQDVPMPAVALGPGTTFQVNSGAWRASPAPVEDMLPRIPVAMPEPEVPAAVAPEAVMPPKQFAPIQQTAKAEPSSVLPTRAAGFVAFARPAAPLAEATPAAAPTAPPAPAEGRMALAGPVAQEAPPPPAVHAERPAVRRHDRPAEIQAPAVPAASTFGPAIFKQIDGRGS